MYEASARRPSGYILSGGKQIAETLQCKHCNMHWQVIKGSGKRRGFCIRCMGPTCGKPSCDTCIPFEKKLDLYEKGKLIILN